MPRNDRDWKMYWQGMVTGIAFFFAGLMTGSHFL